MSQNRAPRPLPHAGAGIDNVRRAGLPALDETGATRYHVETRAEGEKSQHFS